jgi:hypothetical protein
MRAPWLSAYRGQTHVAIKSEAQLRFVSSVILYHSRRAFTLYLVSEPEGRPFASMLLSAFGSTERSHGAAGELVKTFPLRGGGTARHIDLTTTQHADDVIIAKVNELIAQRVFLIVDGADRLPLANPDLSISLRPSQPSGKRTKYLCTLWVGNYTLGTTGLATALSPKWWSIHPAYAELRAQRKR